MNNDLGHFYMTKFKDICFGDNLILVHLIWLPSIVVPWHLQLAPGACCLVMELMVKLPRSLEREEVAPPSSLPRVVLVCEK